MPSIAIGILIGVIVGGIGIYLVLRNRNNQEEKDYINWNIDFFFEKNQTQGLNNFELISEQLNKI